MRAVQKIDENDMVAFKLRNGMKFRLAVCSRKAFGGEMDEYVFVEDKPGALHIAYCITGNPWTGGTTGSGVNIYDIEQLEKTEYTFVNWVENE